MDHITLPPQQQTAYLHRNSKGRGGKSVTLIKNLILSEEDMKSLAKRIKQDCGVGGTVKEGVVDSRFGYQPRCIHTNMVTGNGE